MKNRDIKRVRKDFIAIINAVTNSFNRNPPRYTKAEVAKLVSIIKYWQLENDIELLGALELI